NRFYNTGKSRADMRHSILVGADLAVELECSFQHRRSRCFDRNARFLASFFADLDRLRFFRLLSRRFGRRFVGMGARGKKRRSDRKEEEQPFVHLEKSDFASKARFVSASMSATAL